MDYPINPLSHTDFPPQLFEIPQPPKTLWYQGNLPTKEMKLLAVVGSRKYTSYGMQAVETLIEGLTGYPVGIVSGLAIGVDTLAHEAALKNNLYTLSVPGSGLDPSVLYPARNKNLADKIIKAGGGLLSELSPTTKAATWSFPQRNRIMAGLCHATLLIEAGAKSGTLITARMTVDYNRELLAVPGSIFAKNSFGTHQFIKLGATMVTTSEDIILALGLEIGTLENKPRPELSPEEAKVIEILHEPTDRDTLIRKLKLPAPNASTLLMSMEIQGHIKYNPPHYISLI